MDNLYACIAKFEDFHNKLYMISPIPVSDFINTGILFRQYTGIRFRKYQYISSTPAKAHFQRFEDFKNIGGLINMPRYRIKNKKNRFCYTCAPLKKGGVGDGRSGSNSLSSSQEPQRDTFPFRRFPITLVTD